MFFWRCKNKGTRRSTMRKRATKRIDFIMLWLRRFGIVMGAVVFTLWVGAWFWLSGAVHNAAEWGRTQAIEMSADAGFVVQNILVEGRINTDRDVLAGLVNVQKDDPLFSFSPSEAQALIEKISWVRNVQVERRLPDTIYIGLQERVPIALYQKNSKLSLLDEQGDVITDYGLKHFQNLLLVTGEGAPKNAYDLIQTLNVEDTIFPYIEAASFVSKRRWNLKTRSGIAIKLPAEDLGFALSRLAIFHSENNILDKDLQHIDLRDASRIIVQAVPGKVQEYSINQFKAGYNPGSNI